MYVHRCNFSLTVHPPILPYYIDIGLNLTFLDMYIHANLCEFGSYTLCVCVQTGQLSPVKEIPEFCVEAALYCRRANLEESLPEAEKQHRVK